MKVLAIDYGTKKIGLAISNSERTEVKPLGNLNTSFKNIHEIRQIVDENNITEIVVGVPLTDDSFGLKMNDVARKFIQKLKENFDIKIEEWDESFTTYRAVEMMKEAGIKEGKRNKRGMTDRWAAAIILSEYLDLM